MRAHKKTITTYTSPQEKRMGLLKTRQDGTRAGFNPKPQATRADFDGYNGIATDAFTPTR